MRTSLLTLCLILPMLAQADEPQGLPRLTPEELEKYAFEVEEAPAIIKEPSLSQEFLLSSQRRDIKDLIARHLGVLRLKGDRSDLRLLQDLVASRAIRPEDVRTWQGMGIVFGDILAKELGLHWVSYEDDLSVSKALRWKDTENYVFPVTVFSKRVGFNEKIDVAEIFARIESTFIRVKAQEKGMPVFK